MTLLVACEQGASAGRAWDVSERRDRPCRVLDRVGDAAHEAGRSTSIADPMVEREAQLDDLPDADLTPDDPRPVDDPTETQDRDLGMVDDRRTAVDPEPAIVVEGEGAPGQLLGSRLACLR